ncbi:hypothetical protein N7468_000753 [Penicillium chermesinum]|uniref:Uncharacterized protein n=1 Tax=Penicillium chermesinum TaxID=63820 RepID=A0A9W9PKX2_9EURO|nr:uncharacterized protein N7468_000753 [Penicillium chermesinum]KAJ5249302.1 hypothetical protein N7468_000753 [Penicillium chermesinum]
MGRKKGKANAAQDGTQNETQDGTQNETQNTTQNETQNTTQNETQNAAQNATQNATQNAAQNATQNAAQRQARDIQTPVSDREGSHDVEKQRSEPSITEVKARDIQTPVSDREGSHDVEKQRSEPSITEVKATPQQTRFARSPTRAGDFAPNAGDHHSDDATDVDIDDASEQDAPVESELEPISSWVKKIIRSETLAQSDKMVEQFFTANKPQFAECEQFFQRLNQQIRAANAEHMVDNVDTGVIPETGYNGLCQTWQQAANWAVARKSPQDFWEAFNTTHDLLNTFNKRYHLPQSWNINLEADFASDHLSIKSDVVAEESSVSGLDALEARAVKQQRQSKSAEVLYWWPKGTGSQIFVRYGGQKAPIYRIRAGSHEPYDKTQVKRVLTSQARGTAKVTGTKNGFPEEYWKYKREDVKDLIGVGWKIEDDDEEGLNPLSYLQPAKRAIYPQTRCLVKWKDGITTLEGRAFLRRITHGSALDGDRVIYQKAAELESAYRKTQGLEEREDVDEEDHIDDTESDASSDSASSLHNKPRREPVYSSKASKKTKNHRRYEDSSSSDAESLASRVSSSRRHRGGAASYRQPGRGKSESHEATIRKLEQEIARLKMGKPSKGYRKVH